jgi:cyclic pyranopterin phosphate synthase
MVRDRNGKLTHLDARGQAHMVDVSDKPSTHRRASARATVALGAAWEAWQSGTLAKGDAIATARIAGIQAAKRTAELIPLAHPIPITRVDVDIEGHPEDRSLSITVGVRTVGPTGVEMEAMTAATVAALTIYDMVKGVARDVRIREVELIEKSGGRTGDYRKEARREDD